MKYVTLGEVVQINADVLGGEHTLMDAGLLASAVGRPEQVVFGEDAYPTVFDKAAALFESLCCNHVFLTGNKRTAVVAVFHFLGLNGYQLMAESYEVVDMTIALIAHKIDRHKVAEWFENRVWLIADLIQESGEDEG